MRLSASCATTWTTPVAPTIRMPRRMCAIGASKSTSRRLLLAQQVIRDDALLDLRRALEDLGEPRIAPIALYRMQGRVAGAAEHLQRFGSDPLGHLGGEELHHRRFLVAAPLLVDLVGDEVHQLARRLDVGRHAGQPEAGILEVADRPAELAALLGVGRGVLECTARQADRARRRVGAGALEAGRYVVEGAALL